jgi:hypothetical protein
MWTSHAPLCGRFRSLFSHSINPNAYVSILLHSGILGNFGPCLSRVVMAKLLPLSTKLGSIVLQHDESDQCTSRLANNVLSNKCFYTNSSRHMQVDTQAGKVWRSAAPLKCKIFCWLARCRHLPTNARRFWHRLMTSACCPGCDLDEDKDHMLLQY